MSGVVFWNIRCRNFCIRIKIDRVSATAPYLSQVLRHAFFMDCNVILYSRFPNAWHSEHSGLERIRLLQIALHSAIRSTIILAILFAIHIAILMALAIRLQSNTLSIVLSTILLLKNIGITLQQEDRLSCSSSWTLIRASTRAKRAPCTASLTNWASQKRSLNLRNIIASNNRGVGVNDPYIGSLISWQCDQRSLHKKCRFL